MSQYMSLKARRFVTWGLQAFAGHIQKLTWKIQIAVRDS